MALPNNLDEIWRFKVKLIGYMIYAHKIGISSIFWEWLELLSESFPMLGNFVFTDQLSKVSQSL